jgi:hypothetical protein
MKTSRIALSLAAAGAFARRRTPVPDSRAI